jgi:flagellar hook assembly protein FlgD
VRSGSRLGMIRDNFYGIEEMKNKRGEIKVYPTLGRRFNIESEESIVLKIYNALGKKVTELSSAKGRIVTWDGKDQRGKKLNKGIYFIIIGTKNRLIKKLVLL